jgi:hypothetical protein
MLNSMCVSAQCRKLVSPAGIIKHLRKIHRAKPEVRKQVQEFVAGISWEYDYSTIKLPADGLAPQPVVPVMSAFHCRHCSFRNCNRKNMKTHGNKAHSMKRVADDEQLQPVKLQSWFQDSDIGLWMRASRLRRKKPADRVFIPQCRVPLIM